MDVPILGARKEFEFQTAILPDEAIERVSSALGSNAKVSGTLTGNTFIARVKRPYPNFVAPLVNGTIQSDSIGTALLIATVAVDRHIHLLQILLYGMAAVLVISISGPLALSIAGHFTELQHQIIAVTAPVVLMVFVVGVQKYLARKDEEVLMQWLETLGGSMNTTKRSLTQTISLKKLPAAIAGSNSIEVAAKCTMEEFLVRLAAVMDVVPKLGPLTGGNGDKPFIGTKEDDGRFRIRVKHPMPNIAAPELRGNAEKRGAGILVKTTFRSYLDTNLSSNVMTAALYFIVTVVAVATVAWYQHWMDRWFVLALLLPGIPFVLGYMFIVWQTYSASSDEKKLTSLIETLTAPSGSES